MLWRNRNTLYTVLFLFAVSFFLRVYYLNDGLWHMDAVAIAESVEKSYEERTVNYYFDGYGVIVADLLLYMPYTLLTNNKSAEFIVNFSSALFGALAVVMNYLFFRELAGREYSSFWSSIFLSFTPIFLSVSTWGKEHALSLFIVLLSIYLLARGIKRESNKCMIISAFVLGISPFARAPNIFFIIPYTALFFALKQKERLISEKNLHILISYLTALLLFLMIQGRQTIERSYEYQFQGVSFSNLSAGFSYLLSALGWGWFIIILIIGCYASLRENKKIFVALNVWFLTYFIYYSNVPVTVSRMFTIALPPFFFFLAKGTEFFESRMNKSGVIASILIAVIMFSAIQPVLSLRSVYSGQKEFVLWAENMTQPDSVIIATDDSVFYSYYANRTTIGAPADKDIDKKIDEIKSLMKNNISVYATEYSFAHDITKEFRKSIEKNFEKELVGRHVSEKFHRSETILSLINESLYKLRLK